MTQSARGDKGERSSQQRQSPKPNRTLAAQSAAGMGEAADALEELLLIAPHACMEIGFALCQLPEEAWDWSGSRTSEEP